MSNEIVMMFNGEDDEKLCSNAENEVNPEKVFEAFCRSINSQDTTTENTVSQNDIPFKETNSNNSNGKIDYETYNSKFEQENLSSKMDCSQTFISNINGEEAFHPSVSEAFSANNTVEPYSVSNVVFTTNSETLTASVPNETYATNVVSETFTTNTFPSETYPPNSINTFSANESGNNVVVPETYNSSIQNGAFSIVGSQILTTMNMNSEGILTPQEIFQSNINSEANKVNSENISSISKIDFDQATVSQLQNFDLITANDGDSKEQIKLVDIPDNWQITILETENNLSHCAEPLVVSDQGLYQLWECPKCTALFREKDICENHIRNAHDFPCGLCNEPFEEKDDLINHVVQHISEFQAADVASKSLPKLSTSNRGRPKKRKIEMSSPKKYDSKVDDDFESLSQSSSQTSENFFLDNIPKAKKKGLFICGFCGKECNSEVSFQIHMSKFHSESEFPRFICDVCNACFRSSFSLSNHKASQHKPKVPKNFRCHVCDERFSSNTDLKEHIQNHEEIYPFPCDFCAEKYKTSAVLLNHIKIYHPNGRQFPCGECSKSFKCRKYLEVHISEVHESQKKNCKYCSKAYKNTDSLLAHIQEVHDKEERKYYDCDYCSQSFSTERLLKRHMEIHLSSVQTYDCDYCIRSFSNAKDLQNHTNTHVKKTPSSEDTFDCNWCSRSFGHKENLKLHVKIHHGPMYKEFDYD